MSYDAQQINRLRSELMVAIDKVPLRVRDGGVMAVRSWMDARREAQRIAKKPSATAAELMSAIRRIE